MRTDARTDARTHTHTHRREYNTKDTCLLSLLAADLGIGLVVDSSATLQRKPSQSAARFHPHAVVLRKRRGKRGVSGLGRGMIRDGLWPRVTVSVRSRWPLCIQERVCPEGVRQDN